MADSENQRQAGPDLGALIEERDRAEAANAAKSRLLATVSHEIRTPLSGILGLTGLLLETALTKEQETFAGAIRSSGELLLGLVEELLDLAKLESGHFDLNPKPIDLELLAEELVELLAARAHTKGLDLAAYVSPAVPRPSLLDGPRLRQVLLNLTWNAVKFTERGGAAIVIEAEPQPPPEPETAEDAAPRRLVFSVVDSGPGMDPRIAAELLSGEPGGREATGTGLGLPISRQIVRRMGGEIATAPRPGGGAIFQFDVANDHSAAAPARPDPLPLAERRILAVVHKGPAADVMERHFADAGASVRTVASSYHAAAMAAGSVKNDLVVIDDRTEPDPGSALQLIRMAAGTRLPAIVMVGPARRRDVDRLKEVGFDAYLVRPVRRKSLMRIVDLLLQGTGGFQADPVEVRRAVKKAVRPSGPSLSALLVEDDPVSALLMKSAMERLGHSVVETSNGSDAVALLDRSAERPFDVVVADLRIPGLDGLAVARSIRAQEVAAGRGSAVLIAVTASLAAGIDREAEAAGFDAIMEKPIDPDKLRDLLAQLTLSAAAAA